MTVDPRVITGHSGPLTRWLLSAQQSSLAHDDRLDTLNLDSLTRHVADLPVAEAVTRAEVTLTIEGASTLEIDLHDPEFLVERSGFLDPDENGRLNTAVATVDGLRFRLAARRRQSPTTLTLVFEDEAKSLLSRYKKPAHVSRDQRTRAEFIGAMIAEVKDRDIVYISPQESQRQLIKQPELPNVKPRGSGFDPGVRFKIQGVEADVGQMRNVAIVMAICDQLDVTPRVRLAALVAGIQESLFRTSAKDYKTGTHVGVFQSNQIPARDVEAQATHFLKGGRSFLAGGAIGLAAANHGMSAGEIASRVEISNGNGPAYQQWHDEAKKIAGLWNSGDGGARSGPVTYKSFEFTRGLPGQPETSWEAAVRLADQVNWRFFSIGGVVSFVSDDFLMSKPASLVLDALDGDTWDVPDGLLSMPEYDQDRGKLASSVTLRAVANAWGVLPGEVVVLRNMLETTSSRWIVETFSFDLLDATQAVATLIKPIPPLKEPAPVPVTRASTAGADSTELGKGVQDTLAWARSKIGHYKEEFGANTGRELDALEAEFGFKGAPWCAMFATTALVQGGVSRDARTASVPEINRWAEAGTHGYERGYRATPQPGDLMTFGGDHVALVEKVNRDTVGTIEGNTSAGQVQRLTRARNSGRFVRPTYPE